MSITLTKKESPYLCWELLDIDLGNYLRIVPDRGGLITEWKCGGQDILYFDFKRFTQEEQSVRGGIPILFPICGSLPGNSMLKQHGFARDSKWNIKFIDDLNCLLLSLKDSESSRALYPYSFRLDIHVELEENALKFKICIHNRSQTRMPFSFGLHPYFNVIDLNKLKIEGLTSTCINHINMMKSDTSAQLEDLAKGIDFISGPSESVTLLDLSQGRRIHLQQKEPMNLTVVWTDPPREMVCLEPWTSPRESLISGDRIILLEPEEMQTLTCRFLIQSII